MGDWHLQAIEASNEMIDTLSDLLRQARDLLDHTHGIACRNGAAKCPACELETIIDEECPARVHLGRAGEGR